MRKRNFTSILIMVFWSINLLSQDTINAMFYNLLNFPEAPPINRADILGDIFDEYQPDLFMVCELQTEIGANSILSSALRTTDDRYRAAQFVTNQSNSNSNLQQLVFYNTQKLILNDQNIIITSIRDINHYIFLLNTEDASTDPIYLDVFVTHLKSSQGAAEQQLRLEMVTEFTNALTNISDDHFIIFSGDLNVYTSNESAYQELLDPTNAIVLKDPINRLGSWNNNINFQDIHTQSTRVSSYFNFDRHGAGGGLDDRFDFILISENLLNSSKLHYVNNSYKAFGNNGNCFNNDINDFSCAGTEYSQSLRDNLYNMSDHLPVIMQLQTDQVLNLYDDLHSNNYINIKNGNVISNSILLELDASLLNEYINVYNSLGQLVKYVKIDKTIMYLDATKLSNGIYYITLQNSHNTLPLKFIKI